MDVDLHDEKGEDGDLLFFCIRGEQQVIEAMGYVEAQALGMLHAKVKLNGHTVSYAPVPQSIH